MSGRITGFLREFVLIFSILITIVGLFFIFMGVLYYWFRNLITSTTSPLYFIYKPVGEWNAYALVAGLIIFGTGVYYLYSFLKKRKFVLDELKTDKRSEIIKKRNKLESTVRHLPSKYKRMLAEKEDELGIE